MTLLSRARPFQTVATTPLAGLFCCLVLAAAPLFMRIAGWAVALLLLAGAGRLYLNRRGARLPSLALKVLLFACSAGGIALTYGTMLGIEPGLTVLVILVALKMIETNGERDFQVLALLGFFLCLCALFFSQDLLLWLYVGAVFVLLSGALVRFHSGERSGVARPVWTALVLLLQALPIVVLLFIFFPRTSTGFRFQFSRSLIGSGGMSDRLAPGSISALAMSEEPAFRVDFPDGNTPPLSQMYWRGAVLWRGDGMTWVQGPQLPLERRMGQLGGPAIRQRIILQPHGGRWIFALDRPTNEEAKFELMPGGYLVSPRLIFNRLQYQVISRPENHELTLPVEQMRAALAPAVIPSAQVSALVAEWQRDGAAPRTVVERALHHFHVEKFSYSLTPGVYGDDALDEFLFTRRIGFCEHYAAAFATLMRVAGIPSRVVIGYHGGELNRLGNYVIVRQSDAHAWAEVWLKGTGWLRVDPTEVIAPDRISSGLASFLQTREAGGETAAAAGSDAALGWQDVMRETSLAWDSINYAWELRVLNFDEENQRELLMALGLTAEHRAAELILVLAAIGATLALVAYWLHRPGRRQEAEAARSWEKFCARLALAGVRREPWEGPRSFGERAAAQFQGSGTAIREVAELYSRIRYAPAPPPVRELHRAVRDFTLARK